MFPLEIINMVIAQMGGSGTPGTLPWLRPCNSTAAETILRDNPYNNVTLEPYKYRTYFPNTFSKLGQEL